MRRNPRLTLNIYQLDNYIDQLYAASGDQHLRDFLKDLRKSKTPISAVRFGEILRNLEALPNSNILEIWERFKAPQVPIDKARKAITEICSEYFMDHVPNQTKVAVLHKDLADFVSDYLQHLYTQPPGYPLDLDAWAAIQNLERFLEGWQKVDPKALTLKKVCEVHQQAFSQDHTLIGSFIKILAYVAPPRGWSFNDVLKTICALLAELDPFKRPALWRCFKPLFKIPCIFVDYDLKTYVM